VLGDAHVDRSQGRADPFDARFVDYITRSAWGAVWSDPHFSLRERSLVTLAILAALGRESEFRLHLRGTANTGASREDVREALMHVAAYAGIPAALSAFRIAKEVYAEMEQEASDEA
jgi:4-carboxymuconolactone decarboxylase